LVLDLWTLSHKMSHKMWLMIRNIYLKFEVDTIRSEKVIVKNILQHQNFNLNADAGASRTDLHILCIVELKTEFSTCSQGSWPSFLQVIFGIIISIYTSHFTLNFILSQSQPFFKEFWTALCGLMFTHFRSCASQTTNAWSQIFIYYSVTSGKF
jgi:hypothetical protein